LVLYIFLSIILFCLFFDAERADDETNWIWDDDERWIAQLKLEYEAPMPGFELELAVEQHLNGGDKGERRYNLELSYEF
jgi:hypothetical protein